LRLRQDADGCRRQADREQGADLARCGRQRRDQAATLRSRTLQQVGDDARVFAADGEAHHAAQAEQQPRRRRPDLREGGQERGQQHGQRHYRHRQQQHRPPTVPVGDMAEYDRADRAHQVRNGKPA